METAGGTQIPLNVFIVSESILMKNASEIPLYRPSKKSVMELLNVTITFPYAPTGTTAVRADHQISWRSRQCPPDAEADLASPDPV